MKTRLRLLILVVGVAVLGAVPAVSTAATVVNGGFETGNFAGWTVVNQPGGSGDWFVYTGTTSPLSGFTIAPPPEGTFAAVTDQGGPGSHVLYQDVALEAGFAHTLSFELYYENRAGVFASPATLDFSGGANQQYRVDVLRPSAPATSVAPGDVLATIFQTNPGDPFSLAPTPITFDLTPFAGTTVRIRFAEVDNQLFFQASVDGVAISSRRLLPTSKDQCKNGGWQTFGVFKNQGDCVSFVATRGRNPPANSPADGGGSASSTRLGKSSVDKGATPSARAKAYMRPG
jgi:hypothetical protein